jgi:hypothetical protein
MEMHSVLQMVLQSAHQWAVLKVHHSIVLMVVLMAPQKVY